MDSLFSETTGTLTKMERSLNSLSVTTITQEDIQLVPNKNLLDIIEALVPGTEWMHHAEQSKLGFRGIISDRNYKVLLLFNGHLMNQSAHSSRATEKIRTETNASLIPSNNSTTATGFGIDVFAYIRFRAKAKHFAAYVDFGAGPRYIKVSGGKNLRASLKAA